MTGTMSSTHTYTDELQKRSAFLAERNTGIGGSDIASLFNIGPWGCKRRLFYQKTQTPPDYPQIETNDMRRGTVLENVAAKEWERQNPGFCLETDWLARHPQYEWAIVHVDRWVIGPDGVRDTIAEIKCPSRAAFAHIRRNGLPDGYILQAQHGMFVTGAKKKCLFIVFCADTWEIESFTVERDGDLVRGIREAGELFWNAVQSRIAPDRLESDSPQCQNCAWRKSCQGEALLKGADLVTGEIPFRPELVQLLDEYVELKQITEEADSLLEGCKDRIRDAMGADDVAEAPGFRLYHRAGKPRKTWNGEALWQAYQRLAHCLLDLVKEELEKVPTQICQDLTAREDWWKKVGKEPKPSLRIYAR